MFEVLAAVAGLAAEVSGAALSATVPVVGAVIVEGASAVGSAVAGSIASGAARTAIHGASIEIASELAD